MSVKEALKSTIKGLGIEIRRSARQDTSVPLPVELNEAERKIILYVKERKLSMVSSERLWATVMACKHILEKNIEGDFVECGVWRGGNALLAAAIFELYGSDRSVYLFDTFEGMTEPTSEDRREGTGKSALGQFLESERNTHNEWCYASFDDVRNNFAQAGLLGDRVKLIKGDVLHTLDNIHDVPQKIGVLRLDTDWYESTKKELEVLYPRLSRGGVLIIDDYGAWKGARKAADEYFKRIGNRPFLQYIDNTGRMGVKFD